MEKKSYAQALQIVITDNKRAPPAPTTAFPATAAVPTAVLKQWAVIKKSTQVADETMKNTLAQIADSLMEIRAAVAEQTKQTTNIEARLLQMETDNSKKMQSMKDDIMRETSAMMESAIRGIKEDLEADYTKRIQAAIDDGDRKIKAAVDNSAAINGAHVAARDVIMQKKHRHRHSDSTGLSFSK